MKRSIMKLMSILVLCPSWTSAASICYTSGPMDNRVPDAGVNLSGVFATEALNNGLSNSATIQVLVSALNIGTKENIFDVSLPLGPQSSISFFPDVSDTAKYEVQVKVTGPTSEVHIGGFGRSGAASFPGGSVPAHRLVHSEWAKIACGLFGPEAP